MKTIEEKNRMIDGFVTDWSSNKPSSICIDTKYNTSWELLMPVVIAIKNTGAEGKLIDAIDNVLTCDLSKDKLFNAVVNFIEEFEEE